MESWSSLSDEKKKEFAKIIYQFLNTSSLSDARKLLETYPELLSEDTDSMLETLSKNMQSDEAISAIQNRRRFLARCLEVGIFQAFEEISVNESIQTLLEEIANLSSPHDIPRKITLIQDLLSSSKCHFDPELFASLNRELGNRLLQSSQEKSNNIEQAIKHYNQALEVYTHQDYPIDWAKTLNNLAAAYCNRIQGDIADNIEKAIEYCNLVLEIYTLQAFPADWAITQNNLAIAYFNRIKGDRNDNIEQAIKHYKQALQVYTHQDFPSNWATLQYNLALAYMSRTRDNRAENIKKAIEYFNRSMKLRTLETSPVDWAMTQNGLGNAYCSSILGNKAENIEKSIEHYNQALKVRTYENFPMEWAQTQNNLAAAYWNRIRGDKSDNIEQSIKHYNQALEVYTRQDYPVDWARTLSNLAAAYCFRIRGDTADNIEQSIEYYNHVLKIYTYQAFPMDWAASLSNLANAYRKRVKGDKEENIELAIEYNDKILKVYVRQSFPVEWAMIQYNLANAYCDRIRGDKAENIETAIENYENALEVYTCEDFPVERAMTHRSLASAYADRIRGKVIENIEKAIKYCNLALEVYTHKDFPIEWAETQNTLANVYRVRIRGNRADNIEQAIEYCNHTLKVYTHDDFPVDWTGTQNNLAAAYWNRIKGDKAENIERALEHYNQALEIYTHKDFPIEWAETQNNLATAYNDRILGDTANNIEQAIKHYNQALEVRSKKDLPVDWAETLNNLANSYYDRVRGDKSDNIEQAIEYYCQALEVKTKKSFPMDWAGIQNNLALAYLSRIKGDREENVEQAIEYFNKALEVRTNSDFPVDWAGTQNNLALAFMNRIKGDREENIKKAIKLFHNSLQIYKLESMPSNFRRVCRLLGDLYFNMNQWGDAANCYRNAIKADDILYRSGLSMESKAIEIKENSYIYQNFTLASCHLGSYREGMLILEAGKTRLLYEALRLKIKQPESVPKDQWIIYEKAAENYRVAAKPYDCRADYAQREKNIQKALEELDAAINVIQDYDPKFQKELEISDILSIPDNETALLTFCITDRCSIGFLITGLYGIQVVAIPNFKIKDLNSLLFDPNEQGLISGGWVGDYLSYLNALGTNHHENTFQAWKNTLNEILFKVSTTLLNPLLVKLPSQIKRLVFLPSGSLNMLPLHASPLFDGQPLCQRYSVSYSPSIRLLREMKSKAGTVKGKGIYEVINPQEDPFLVFSECEGRTISKLFQNPQVNIGETGTRATVLYNVPGKEYLHFSCHGSYNWNEPFQSGLYLAGGRILSLADLQSNIVDMSSTRLITLSACETGITDIVKGSADEFVCLPAGFMLAGIPYVVSSLWSVPEISTAILMERFYSNHIVGGMNIPLALQDAQLWVKDLTSKQVADYVEKCYRLGKWEGKSKEIIEKYRDEILDMAKGFPDEKPFQHPYYWAAFTVNGA